MFWARWRHLDLNTPRPDCTQFVFRCVLSNCLTGGGTRSCLWTYWDSLGWIRALTDSQININQIGKSLCLSLCLPLVVATYQLRPKQLLIKRKYVITYTCYCIHAPINKDNINGNESSLINSLKLSIWVQRGLVSMETNESRAINHSRIDLS